MSAQMNIKNTEAREIAIRIAKAKGLSVTGAVLAALRTAEHELKKQDRDAWWNSFLEEGRRLNAGRPHEPDPTAFLYDDAGMPK